MTPVTCQLPRCPASSPAGSHSRQIACIHSLVWLTRLTMAYTFNYDGHKLFLSVSFAVLFIIIYTYYILRILQILSKWLYLFLRLMLHLKKPYAPKVQSGSLWVTIKTHHLNVTSPFPMNSVQSFHNFLTLQHQHLTSRSDHRWRKNETKYDKAWLFSLFQWSTRLTKSVHKRKMLYMYVRVNSRITKGRRKKMGQGQFAKLVQIKTLQQQASAKNADKKLARKSLLAFIV